jgi:hypothetical protein
MHERRGSTEHKSCAYLLQLHAICGRSTTRIGRFNQHHDCHEWPPELLDRLQIGERVELGMLRDKLVANRTSTEQMPLRISRCCCLMDSWQSMQHTVHFVVLCSCSCCLGLFGIGTTATVFEQHDGASLQEQATCANPPCHVSCRCCSLQHARTQIDVS